MRKFVLSFLMLMVLGVTGCGTIMSSNQDISFTSDVPGVRISGGGQTCITPCELNVPTASHDLSILAEKEGYEPQYQSLKSRVNPLALLGDILFVYGFFSTTTDASSGHLYNYSPNRYHVIMGQRKDSPTSNAINVNVNIPTPTPATPSGLPLKLRGVPRWVISTSTCMRYVQRPR